MRRFIGQLTIGIAFHLVCLTNVLGQQLVGKIVAVKDGDSIELLTDSNHLVRIRLAAIDCPEHNQAWGTKAKKYTSLMCFGKFVKAKVVDKDRYGRSIAFVCLPDSTVLNERLLKEGLAWHYTRYSIDSALSALEKSAREKQLGLWSDKAPVAPWEFRHNK